MSETYRLEIVDSLREADPGQWNALAGNHPLLSHAFLHAMHESGSASERSGWAPRYLLLREGGVLLGAVPLYLKSHSYGEYVFDWAWADAWNRAGREYYPKLLSAIPFTPVTGPRLMAASAEIRRVLVAGVLQFAREADVSSFHCLFPSEAEAREFEDEGLMLRRTVQFHWHNPGYTDFDDFLAGMNHEKRKKVKQERRRLRDEGVSFAWKVGHEIGEDDWRFFAQCYNDTYRRHHSTPYLNLDFFLRIGETMPDNLLLAVGSQDGTRVCSALDVFSADALYGRYWGTTRYIPGLHFEACYYQAIEFCIDRKIGRFEGGAQGEHKLARGLEPVTTFSAHWVGDPAFDQAVRRFVARESNQIAAYVNELAEHSPFKEAPLEL